MRLSPGEAARKQPGDREDFDLVVKSHVLGV